VVCLCRWAGEQHAGTVGRVYGHIGPVPRLDTNTCCQLCCVIWQVTLSYLILTLLFVAKSCMVHMHRGY
jgi:hypothetical protein